MSDILTADADANDGKTEWRMCKHKIGAACRP